MLLRIPQNLKFCLILLCVLLLLLLNRLFFHFLQQLQRLQLPLVLFFLNLLSFQIFLFLLLILQFLFLLLRFLLEFLRARFFLRVLFFSAQNPFCYTSISNNSFNFNLFKLTRFRCSPLIFSSAPLARFLALISVASFAGILTALTS